MAAEPAAYSLLIFCLIKRRRMTLPARWKTWAIFLGVLSIGLLAPVAHLPRENFEVLAYSTAILLGFFPTVAFIILFRNELIADSFQKPPDPEVVLGE